MFAPTVADVGALNECPHREYQFINVQSEPPITLIIDYDLRYAAEVVVYHKRFDYFGIHVWGGYLVITAVVLFQC